MSSPPPFQNGNGPLSNGSRASTADPWATHSQRGRHDADDLIPDNELPALYKAAFEAAAEGSTAVSVGAMAKVLRGAGLQTGEVDKILNLTASGRDRLTKGEFAVALALTGFAQQKQEISIEQVVAHKESLPVPRLASTAALDSRPRKISVTASSPTDPWGSRISGPITPGTPEGMATSHYPGASWGVEGGDSDGFGIEGAREGAFQVVSTAQLEKERDLVEVKLDSLKGQWLNKYTVFEVVHAKHGSTVTRRYSDFAWLHGCLERRYPFRLLPALPPKRLAINGAHAFADDGFLERRRRGLQRYLTWLANHHVLKFDGLLHTFLTEPDVALWRKTTPVSLDEESLHRRLTPAEEMQVPADLAEKLADFRSRLTSLIDHWTKACQTMERIARRREAQATDWGKLGGELDAAALADQPDSSAGGYRPAELDVVEREVGQTSEHLGRMATTLETRAMALALEAVERFKAHRALYTDFGALLARQDRLAPDAVDRLNKRVETAQRKLEVVRREKKEKWETEADKLASAIEQDQRAVEILLRRRIFIRFALWEELRFMFRCSRLLSITLRGFSDTERVFHERVTGIWRSLSNTLGEVS